MRRHLIACSITAALITASPAASADTEYMAIERQRWIEAVNTLDPTNGVWSYISGLVSGAITGALAATGGSSPLICDPHAPTTDIELTRQVLFDFMSAADLWQVDGAILEVVAPLAFMRAYPCGTAI